MWKQEDHEFQASLGKVIEILSQKQDKTKRLGHGLSGTVLA
jgi:hypothetical protein